MWCKQCQTTIHVFRENAETSGFWWIIVKNWLKYHSFFKALKIVFTEIYSFVSHDRAFLLFLFYTWSNSEDQKVQWLKYPEARPQSWVGWLHGLEPLYFTLTFRTQYSGPWRYWHIHSAGIYWIHTIDQALRIHCNVANSLFHRGLFNVLNKVAVISKN